jgi:hypothetical protein
LEGKKDTISKHKTDSNQTRYTRSFCTEGKTHRRTESPKKQKNSDKQESNKKQKQNDSLVTPKRKDDIRNKQKNQRRLGGYFEVFCNASPWVYPAGSKETDNRGESIRR